jgi:hypothetical protein
MENLDQEEKAYVFPQYNYWLKTIKNMNIPR